LPAACIPATHCRHGAMLRLLHGPERRIGSRWGGIGGSREVSAGRLPPPLSRRPRLGCWKAPRCTRRASPAERHGGPTILDHRPLVAGSRPWQPPPSRAPAATPGHPPPAPGRLSARARLAATSLLRLAATGCPPPRAARLDAPWPPALRAGEGRGGVGRERRDSISGGCGSGWVGGLEIGLESVSYAFLC
jgi:hypothetical protein